LRIGLTSDAATVHLSEILAAFHARLPKVLVELVELSGSKVFPALRANTIDLAAKLSLWFARRPKREWSHGCGGSKRSWMGPVLHSGYATAGPLSCWRAPVPLLH
jgi:DNA-binding transcriptional LysR family regulator